MPEYVYNVAELNVDISRRFMDMRGCFKSEAEAKKHREFLYESKKIETEVMRFALLDTIGD